MSRPERPVFRRSHDLPFSRGVVENDPYHGGRFAARNPLNVPGMFYGAATDTCGTGPMEAPFNIALDASGQEFVFRQPRDDRELHEVYCACWAECFDGYGTDGNEHWTPELVRAWWATREVTREAWRAAGIADVDAMFELEVPRYLRGYLFFLASGRAPTSGASLPAL